MTVACTRSEYKSGEGTLSFGSFSVSLDDSYVTKAVTDAPDTYSVVIVNSEGEEALNTTLGDCTGGVVLPVGSYTITVTSQAAPVPAAEFEAPVYTAKADFSIAPGKTTYLDDLVCRLAQCAVSVAYTDEFLEMITGDAVTTVTVTSGSPLEYALHYSPESCSYDQRKGYFAVKEGSSTSMEVVFKGQVDGRTQKMTKVFTGLEPRQWRTVTFTKKVDVEGNATFDISINKYVEDEDLTHDILAEETIIGEDPSNPSGDGDIRLESTCAYDITQPIDVPALGTPFSLTMKAFIPNGVKKFSVEIHSTSENFLNSVGAVNDGQTILDLVNPSEGAQQVFTNILPFPYGSAVSGKTEIDFNLSDAQVPILAFPGAHTFEMKVVDAKGCKKNISIILNVK